MAFLQLAETTSETVTQSRVALDMDAAAIALKIRGWDDQINNSMEEPPVGMVSLDDTPLSPTRTEDTGVTEDLGSINNANIPETDCI